MMMALLCDSERLTGVSAVSPEDECEGQAPWDGRDWLTGRECTDSGVIGNDGRWSRCEGGNGMLGSACPLHASSAPSEVVVRGRSAWVTMRGEKPRSGEQFHEYLMGWVLTIFAGAPFLNMPHSSSIKWLVIWVQFAGENIPCGICEMVNGWKWW